MKFYDFLINFTRDWASSKRFLNKSYFNYIKEGKMEDFNGVYYHETRKERRESWLRGIKI